MVGGDDASDIQSQIDSVLSAPQNPANANSD